MNIETGCKAEIVNSSAGNNGIVVIVGKCLGGKRLDACDLGNKFGDRWAVDIPLLTNFGATIQHIGEGQLRRIDDEDKDTMISWEQMSDLWIPEDICEIS